MSRLKADLILLFVAAVWGSGFVAQRFAANLLNPNYFNGGRYLLAALLLLPLTQFKWKVEKRHLPLMMLAGAFLFAASWLQQAGLATTTISNASFITGLYVVLVPIVLFLVMKKKLHWLSWVAALLAGVGVGFLTLQGELKLVEGDLLELGGAFVWAFHIILVGRLAQQGVDILWFAIIQFTSCALLSLAFGFGLDPQGVQAYALSWQAVVYSAIIPVGLGFTLQAVGQRGAPPVDAAIILSMEAVFATIFGYLFMNEILTLQQLFGCVLILAAMILAQMKMEPDLKEQKEEMAWQ